MYRNTSTIGHDNLFNIFQVGNHTFRTDVIGTVYLFYITTSGILVIAAQCIVHIADGDIERIQGIRIDSHFILLQVSSEAVDFHNAWNTRKLSFHNPVLNGTQLHGIIFILIPGSHFQYILIDFTQTGGNRHHLRHTQLRRYFSGHGLYLLIHQLTGIQCGHTFLEHHGHQRQAETGHGTNFLHIHDVAHGHFYRKSNQLFHLLRGQSGRHGNNLYLIIGNVGHCIDGQCQH